jgi:eukaryotic-like serine/threonine-protein kinase
MSLAALPPGTTINDRYELEQKLGSYGAVYRAHDRYLDKTVAIKLLEPIGGQARSWAEAQRLEQLRSRFLVDVINADVVMSSDIRFIVTPILPAGDLEAVCAGTGLWVADAVRYTQQIAAGVDRIHDAGMVHRDIKPANVLLDGGEILVSDLEFCELLDAHGRAGRNGSWCTLAPEVAAGNGYCGIASDVYSIGATAVYLLSGDYPVDHRLDKAEQKARIEAGRIRDVRDLAPHVSQRVGTVVRKALSLDPAKRHSTALAFANALVHAARNSRNWRRVGHGGHTHCLEGAASPGKAAVGICSFVDGSKIQIQPRYHPSGRRIAGLDDEVVTMPRLPKALRRLANRLS